MKTTVTIIALTALTGCASMSAVDTSPRGMAQAECEYEAQKHGSAIGSGNLAALWNQVSLEKQCMALKGYR